MEVIVKRFGNFITKIDRDLLTIWIVRNVPSPDGGTLHALTREEKLIEYAKTKNYTFEVTGKID